MQRQFPTEYAEREGLHVVQEFEDVETAKRAARTACGEAVDGIKVAWAARASVPVSRG